MEHVRRMSRIDALHEILFERRSLLVTGLKDGLLKLGASFATHRCVLPKRSLSFAYNGRPKEPVHRIPAVGWSIECRKSKRVIVKTYVCGEGRGQRVAYLHFCGLECSIVPGDDFILGRFGEQIVVWVGVPFSPLS